MIRAFRAIALLTGLALAGPAQVLAQENITLTIDEARQLASNAVNSGQFELALNVSSGLLQRDPNDYAALMQAAAAYIGLGRLDEAASTARRAFQVARTKAERVNAARLAASAHFRAKQYTRAEIWLRRAFNNATDGQSQLVLRSEFAQVRQQNPFTANLAFSVAPNDNINNGSSSETILIWNLPFVLSADARALSGIETSANIGLKYRLSRSQVQETNIGLTLYGRTYELSKAARAAAPTVKGSDYSFAMAELSLTHDRKFAAMSGPTSFGVTAGRYWYAGDPYISYARTSLAQSLVLSERISANLQLGYEKQKLLSAGGVVSRISSLGGGLSHLLGNQDRVGLNFQLSKTASADPTAENRATKAQVTYAFGKVIMGAQLSLNLSAERRDYPLSIYDPAGRHDRTVTAGLNMVFVNTTIYGFSPTMSIEASRTRSNVSLYDRESAAIRFGIQSTF